MPPSRPASAVDDLLDHLGLSPCFLVAWALVLATILSPLLTLP